MRRMMVIVIFGVLCGGVAHADVSTEEKSQVKFAGMLGRMMNLFGGGAARDGIVSTMAVKGDRKVTRTDQKEQIVDLKEEKVYIVDLKDKSYTVTTFADMRKQMEEAQKKAAEQAQRASPPEAKPKAGQQAPEMDVDFSLKESGAKKAINGFDAREVVMTIAVREKGKTLEQNGGLVMTTSSWLTQKIAAMKEVADFDRRFAEKLALPTMIDAQQMATVTAMYPGMKDAMKRLDVENVKLEGTAVLTTTTVDAVGSAEQTAQAKPQPKEEAPPASLGGLAGRLARRAVKKDPEPAPAAQSDNRATFMTVQHEVLKVSPTVTEADLQIPAGFKLKN